MKRPPRIAFFTDCFHEVNGVALTSRRLAEYARRQQLPMLCIHGDSRSELRRAGTFWELRLKRGRFSFSLERDFQVDLLSIRHARAVRRVLRAFQPDLIHVTSTGDIGGLGFAAAALTGYPLVASWHTQVHEFAGRRLESWLRRWPSSFRRAIAAAAVETTRRAVLLPYRGVRLLLAPTRELAGQLQQWTGKPCELMGRGVDTRLFSPGWRTRPSSDKTLSLGFVGRLSAEKNLDLLIPIEKALLEAGLKDFRFVLVGEGGDRARLLRQLKQCRWTGVLRGEELSKAVADLDLLVFPSKTDTFGNAVQEALASGVPAVVTDKGGPKHIVRHDQSGWVAGSDEEFIQTVVTLAHDRPRLARMSRAARLQSLGRTWSAAFEDLWRSYASVVEPLLNHSQSRNIAPAPQTQS